MTKFKEIGFTNIQGNSMSDEDVKATQDKGFPNAKKWINPFMTFEDESFDFPFC